uniref:Uncharacterized protein n=1 Tax=Globodera rostochiensis TaxID=31243 RepID=A0A914I232_GLORO
MIFNNNYTINKTNFFLLNRGGRELKLSLQQIEVLMTTKKEIQICVAIQTKIHRPKISRHNLMLAETFCKRFFFLKLTNAAIFMHVNDGRFATN